MAKMSGLVGGLSGKMGNAVFRQRKGQQIVAQYQPVVSNPRSTGQSDQRSRFKLMSQLAAVVAEGLGGTMSVLSRPERGASPRNNFVKENFPLSRITGEVPEESTAVIDLTALQLTRSFRPISNLSLDTTGGDNVVKANMINIPSNIKSVRLVTLGSSNNLPIIIDTRIVSVVNNEITEDINIPAYADPKKAVVLAYGVIPLTSKGSQDLENIIFNDQKEVSLTLMQDFTEGSTTETVTVGAEATWQA